MLYIISGGHLVNGGGVEDDEEIEVEIEDEGEE